MRITYKVVLIWLDAFSDRYIHPKNCPFIYRLSKGDSFAKIRPLFAYEGIKACFDTGLPISVHKIWGGHIFNSSSHGNWTKSNLFKKVLRLIDKISPTDDVNKILRYFWFKMNKVQYGTPHLIPACLIDLFPRIEKKYVYKDLYQMLMEHDIRYVWKEPKLMVEEPFLFKRIPELLKRYDVVFAKLNSLDRLGHKYGPLSNVVKQRVKYLDGLLYWLAKKLTKRDVLIIMSEHGMAPVKHHIDLLSFLKKRGFHFGHHYVGFIGATYAAFWFKEEKYKNLIKNALKTLDVGKLLTRQDKVSLGIDRISKECGDETFVIKEHYVIFPEFYHWRSPPKGMHGYAFSKYDMPIFLIQSNTSSIKLIKDKIDFINIMPTFLQLLDLPLLPNLKGKPLLV